MLSRICLCTCHFVFILQVSCRMFAIDVGDPGRLRVLSAGWLLVFVRCFQRCTICQNWTTNNKLRKSLVDARLRTIQRERQHWTSVFPYIEAWVTNKPASTVASSEPGSEISFFVDSELQNHLKLGGTIQEHDEHLYQIWI